eukprot:652329-Hanusia_phi.AAC.1
MAAGRPYRVPGREPGPWSGDMPAASRTQLRKPQRTWHATGPGLLLRITPRLATAPCPIASNK